jgi:hypothetical protein
LTIIRKNYERSDKKPVIIKFSSPKDMGNPNQILYEALWDLDATGPDGFEGLIAQLLETPTGKRFFLAKSGFQGGRDMSTGNRNANAIECKRYQSNTDLDDRQLLGELQQVSWSTPDLDLWVLVTTRPVSAQLVTDLKRSVWEKGFETSIIDTFETNGGPPSSLATLCAHNPDITLQFLQKKRPKRKVTDIRKILNTIRQHPGYQETLEELRSEFSTAVIGYDNWRYCQSSWLLERFQSQSESRAAFNQIINVLDTSAWNVERETINVHLTTGYRILGRKSRCL